MNLELENHVVITVRMLQGKYIGQEIPMRHSLDDYLYTGVADLVIQGGLVEEMGHPCDCFDVVSVEYLED